MNIIMSKLIRDVVMHWIYTKVWLTAKPFLYLLKIGYGLWTIEYEELEKKFSIICRAQLDASICQYLSSIIFICKQN